MRLRTLATALAVGFLVSACARSSTSGGGTTGAIEHATGASDLILRVDVGGGFVNPVAVLDQLPQLSIYGDGTAIAPGVRPEIYPGPAIEEPIVTPVTEDGIQAILGAAGDAGLFRSVDYTDLGSLVIADAPTTTITVNADGSTFTTRVYALGELTAPKPDGMSQAEFDARTAIAGFVGRTVDLRSWLPQGSVGEDAPYGPVGLAVYAVPYVPDQGGPTEPALDWPLSAPLAGFGKPVELPKGMRCGAVTGRDLATLLPEAGKANQLTPWTDAGDEYTLVFRPLLPDQVAC